MSQMPAITTASDPYFQDIIREMEAIAPAASGEVGRRF
jgi:hypothetical protein